MGKFKSLGKGHEWERDVAKYLKEKTGVEFFRVPMSGAFSTNTGAKSGQFLGDVFTEEKKYSDTCIECKSYKEMKITEFFNPNSKLFDWFAQAENESHDLDGWIVFFKINHLGMFMAYDTEYNTELIQELNAKHCGVKINIYDEEGTCYQLIKTN